MLIRELQFPLLKKPDSKAQMYLLHLYYTALFEKWELEHKVHFKTSQRVIQEPFLTVKALFKAQH